MDSFNLLKTSEFNNNQFFGPLTMLPDLSSTNNAFSTTNSLFDKFFTNNQPQNNLDNKIGGFGFNQSNFNKGSNNVNLVNDNLNMLNLASKLSAMNLSTDINFMNLNNNNNKKENFLNNQLFN